MILLVFVVSILVGVLLAEISFYVFGGIWFDAQLKKIHGLLQEFHSAAGDEVRQELLLRSGLTTLQFSLCVLGLLVVLAIIAFVMPWTMGWDELQQTVYIVATSLAATGWWLFRRPRRNASTQHISQHAKAYGALERSLHWLALEPAIVRHLAFDLERQFALPNRAVLDPLNNATDPADGAVYVCGLARSGTTMLLRVLDEIDVFRSLTYREMPFVLAPNLWKQVTRHVTRQSVSAERAHGDGIHVDLDSPEGFEEVFWRTFSKSTSNSSCLGVEQPSPDTLSAFADYRALVANPRTEPAPANGVLKRYLSKNNNNLLRLTSLSADPTAAVLLVYRNPVATARSLHRQHKRFCVAHNEDRFTRIYMAWLAHHEFGLDHLPFCFAVPNMDTSLTPDDQNYWLDYWDAVYQHILAQSSLRLHLVNYDALCAEPVSALNDIFSVLSVEADTTALAKNISAPTTNIVSTDGFCIDLLHRAETTHRALLINQKNIIVPMAKPK